MTLWKTQTTLDQLKERSKNTLIEHLGIEFLEIGDDYLKAKMPVDRRTKQPAGLLHGGASVVLRNLSMTLRHPASEFSVLFPRSKGPVSAY